MLLPLALQDGCVRFQNRNLQLSSCLAKFRDDLVSERTTLPVV